MTQVGYILKVQKVCPCFTTKSLNNTFVLRKLTLASFLLEI